MTNTPKNKPRRQMYIAENKKYRKYIYLEDENIVGEKYFELENGLEIPAEEPKDNPCILRIPEDPANAETIQIIDPKTGKITSELLKGPAPKDKKEALYVKIFNKTKNIGEMHTIVNGLDVETRFYTIENGREMFIPRPENDDRNFTVPIHNIDNMDQLQLFDKETNDLMQSVPRKHVLHIDDAEIEFGHEDMELVHNIMGTVSGLSEEDKIKLKKALSKPNSITTLEGKTKSKAEYDEVRGAVEDILSTPNSDFYKSINTDEEFGVSRIVSDKMYHLPELLRGPKLIHQEGTSTYIVRAETGDSYGNQIKFEHRFISKTEEAAQETSKIIIQRLQTVQHKIWLAAWQLANKLGRFTYTCQLTTLMHLCYPERGGYFSTKEKVQFYEDLRSLESTKILFSKKIKPKGRLKKPVTEDYEIRLLEIEQKRGTQEKYPSQLTLTILNPKAFQNKNNKKMAFLAAGFKHKTLELHANDLMLAQVIQTRKSQCMDKKFLRFDVDYIMGIAGLKKTYNSKKSVANKKLLQKLKRYEDKGIILKAPLKINDTVSIRIR